MKVGGRRGRSFSWLHLTAGFTIVETMIVLAVTGALFIIIAASLSGRQNAAEFTHAIQSIQSQLQQTIDQVAAGYFPTQADFQCQAGAGSVLFQTGNNGQGTNEQCVFLGKVIQFAVGSTTPEQYIVYTVAGIQGATAGASSPFSNAGPTVVDVNNDYADYSTAGHLEYGMTTAWVRSTNNSACTDAACSIGAVAFLMEPGSLSSSGTSGYNSGGQPVDLIPVRTTMLNQVPDGGGGAIAAIQNSNSNGGGLRDQFLTASAPINPPMGVQICFVSAGTNQSGLITIGNNGRQLQVTLDMKSNRTCQ